MFFAKFLTTYLIYLYLHGLNDEGLFCSTKRLVIKLYHTKLFRSLCGSKIEPNMKLIIYNIQGVPHYLVCVICWGEMNKWQEQWNFERPNQKFEAFCFPNILFNY